jgi:hypothetical protein
MSSLGAAEGAGTQQELSFSAENGTVLGRINFV